MEGNSRRKKSIGLGEAEEAELKNRDDDEPELLGETRHLRCVVSPPKIITKCSNRRHETTCMMIH